MKLELPVCSRLLSLFIQTFAERQLRLPNSPSFSWTLALLPSPTWRATHAHSKERGRTCVFVAGHGGISVCRIRRRNNHFAQGRSERTCPPRALAAHLRSDDGSSGDKSLGSCRRLLPSLSLSR